MSLSTKLVISFTILLLVAITVVGAVASRSVENILVGQIDAMLIGFADRGPGPGPGDGGEGPPRDGEDLFFNPFAEVVIAPDGTVAFSKPSGFADDPDPLPDVSGLEGTEGLIYLDSVDKRLEYRAHVTTVHEDAVAVRAAPLDEIASATTSLMQTLLLTGLVVLLVGAIVTWWTVQRSMRPIGEMVDTAEAIAAGELTRRVPESDPGTELGRLGASLNEMLSTIEEALTNEQESQERLRRFVADASHELRTPVTAIGGYAELRRKGGLAGAEAEDRAWSRIESESARMAALVEDLIMLARLGEGQPLSVETVDLSAIARDAAADHATIDRDRPVTVEAPDSVMVTGDNQRLHQVISNLLANVRVHTAPGTLTTVRVEDQGAWAVLTVIDDGPGIPEESLDRVFQRFHRADRSRSRKSGGSGLGLSIVQAIVEAHGGTVDADNDPGGGARFTVRLPKSTPA
jgi:two-component system OmpR family sensor kinase